MISLRVNLKTMIPRFYADMQSLLKPNKVLILYGPRRVGKTTLLREFLTKTPLKYRLDSGDNIRIQHVMGSSDFRQILEYAQGYELIAIDEAQQIPNIGMGLKILVDEIPGIRVIVTGSSSFDIMQKTGEPLTGRKRTLTLYPFSQIELSEVCNTYELKEKLSEFLIFGSYPEVVTAKSIREKKEILFELTNSYVLRDILSFELLKGSQTLLNLLKLLAFQVSSQVSVHELAVKLGINVRTVSRYLDLLEKTFIIYRLGAFSGNLRNEIATKSKYYFLDNGIRNALIDQLNPLETRNDHGQLWENFVLTERLKKIHYQGMHGNLYFWRSYKGGEIDLIEERDGQLNAFEFNWTQGKTTLPKEFSNAYPQTGYSIITRDNYLGFIR